MIEFRCDLTPTDYAAAAADIARAQQKRVDSGVIERADNALSRWTGRLFVLLALLAFVAWVAISFGVGAWQTMLALVAVPVGLGLWIFGERTLGRVSEGFDSRLLDSYAKEWEGAIAKGSVRVPLGEATVRLNDAGARVEAESLSVELPWNAVGQVHRSPRGVLLLSKPIRKPSDLSGCVLVPLDAAPDAQAVLETIGAKTGR